MKDVTSEEYIRHAAGLVGETLPAEHINLSALLELMADIYRKDSDDAFVAITLFTIIVGVYIRTGEIPAIKPDNEIVFRDELLAGAQALVYSDTDYTWSEIGSTARTILYRMLLVPNGNTEGDE